MNIIWEIMGKTMVFKWRFNVTYHFKSDFSFFSRNLIKNKSFQLEVTLDTVRTRYQES